MQGNRRSRTRRQVVAWPAGVTLVALAAACFDAAPPRGAAETPDGPVNAVARILEDGGTVFAIRPAEMADLEAVRMMQVQQADFVFLTLERGPWDMTGLRSFLGTMRQVADESDDPLQPLPVLLRIPPVRDLGPDVTRQRVLQALASGVDGIIFPHVQSPEEVQVALTSLGDPAWPMNPHGSLIGVPMIEDRVAVERAREILGVPGVRVTFLGPMSLGEAYDGDPEAVEQAIQSVLAVCKELGVACGITAGVEDVAERVEQGFRFFVLRDEVAIDVGRRAAGR